MQTCHTGGGNVAVLSHMQSFSYETKYTTKKASFEINFLVKLNASTLCSYIGTNLWEQSINVTNTLTAVYRGHSPYDMFSSSLSKLSSGNQC